MSHKQEILKERFVSFYKSLLAHSTSELCSDSLFKHILLGLTAGAMAGFSVAPFVSTIDKSIVQNASGAATMKQSIRASVRDICIRYVSLFPLNPH